MLRHYIKVAFRNLWKYKTQSLISVIGLAVGFTCFALASLWIRYEMTYDSFHKNAKDTYAIVLPTTLGITGLTMQVPYPFAEYLKKTFPEVKEAINIRESYPVTAEANGLESESLLLYADQGILNILDIHILEGRFPEADKDEIAITKEKATLLFGDENPIGQTIKPWGSAITAVVSGYSNHSNFPFDFILPIAPNGYWNQTSNEGLLMLHPGVDAEAFKQKLKDHEVSQGDEHPIEWTNTTLIPLTKLHYEDPLLKRSVKFEHIGLFGLIGLLVILCSLFNYVTLFVSRFRIRNKEFALRLVCGGSRKSLISLLSIEYLLSLILASFLGFCLVKILLPSFEDLSEIRMSLSGIYGELALYFLGVLFLSLIAFWIAIGLFGKRSLQVSIQKSKKQFFRKLSIVIQLFITIGMIFCSLVMIKQIHYLHNSSNIGFEYKNRASIRVYGEQFDLMKNKLQQIPEIEETLTGGYIPLLPVNSAASAGFVHWDDQPEGKHSITLQQFPISDEYIRFYDIQLLEGEAIGLDSSPEDILLNESAVKAAGWEDPIGKTFGGYGKTHKVKGVLKNIYNQSSTVEVKPFYYISPDQSMIKDNAIILFKFKEGSWDVVRSKIKVIEEEHFSENYVSVTNTEEEYDKLFKSETSLILILNFVSLVCVLISVFGFFSLIALNLEERRKEMAIRKVNGATPRNIIGMYFKEYFLLLLISSLIAFPVAYVIMKRWLEQYIHQTEISVWIYVVILFVIAIVIALCTGWRIWRSSRENPVESLKMS
ncbi:ABC transporter permease [Bacteroidales bacterium OttesenSCG-928-A17]|nr:ABC transporter permease [Bacteroidales bacterium OttesenSCG-928-A17]